MAGLEDLYSDFNLRLFSLFLMKIYGWPTENGSIGKSGAR